MARLGGQADYFYVDFKEGFGQNCAHGVAYISPENKGLFAVLLAAKLNGKILSRVDYQQLSGPGTTCNLKIAEIN